MDVINEVKTKSLAGGEGLDYMQELQNTTDYDAQKELPVVPFLLGGC